MKGAHAARNADTNVIRQDIFILAHNDAEKRGWSMLAMIEKTNRGIKSECTARFLLPFTERGKYLKDPERYVFCAYQLILIETYNVLVIASRLNAMSLSFPYLARGLLFYTMKV